MQLGYRIRQDKADKLIRAISGHLSGEPVRFVCAINSFRPLADRLVVTDQRLLAISAMDDTVKWTVFHGEVQETAVDKKWDKLTFFLVDGSRMKFGSVRPDDQDVVAQIVNGSPPAPATTPPEAQGALPQMDPGVEAPVVDASSAVEAADPTDAKEVRRQEKAAAKLEEKRRKEAERLHREEQKKMREAEIAKRVGRCVLTKNFGAREIKLFANGYVVVGPNWFTDKHEKLIAISADRAVQEKSRGGRGVAAVATMGVSTMYSSENFKAFLTIVTEGETHSFQAEGAQAYKTALALATAGTALIQAPVSTQESPRAVEEPTSRASLTEQLRELSALHAEGVLSDTEFESAKRKILEGS